MSGTRQKIQYSLALVPEGRGEAPGRGHQGTEPPGAKPAPERPACAEQLMEEVCDRGNLVRAWKRVCSNRGSPGQISDLNCSRDLPAAAGQEGRNPQAGWRGQKARRPVRRR